MWQQLPHPNPPMIPPPRNGKPRNGLPSSVHYLWRDGSILMHTGHRVNDGLTANWATWKGLKGLDNSLYCDLHWGWGWVGRTRGRGRLGCLASISLYTSTETGASPSDVRACIAFLYWPSSIARRERLTLATREDSSDTFLCLPRQWLSLSSPIPPPRTRDPGCHLLVTFPKKK